MRRFLMVVMLSLMSMSNFGFAAHQALSADAKASPGEAISLGESGMVGTFEFEVDEFTPDASNLLDPAGPGVGPDSQVINITLTMTNPSKEAQWFPLVNYMVAGNRGVLDPAAGYGICKVEESFWDIDTNTQLQPGQSLTFNLCDTVAQEDIASLRLALDDFSGDDAARVWFDLGAPDAYDPAIATGQRKAALDAVETDNAPIDAPASAGTVVSTGNIVYDLVAYDEDATQELVQAGITPPVAGFDLARVELAITNVSDGVVSPSVQLPGRNGVGYAAVSAIPVAVAADLPTINLLPGGRAHEVLVFPLRSEDTGNHLLYLGEEPLTAQANIPDGIWMIPNDALPQLDTLAPIEPGRSDYDPNGVPLPSGTRVLLGNITVSISSVTLDTNGSAELHVLLENQDGANVALDPDIIANTAEGRCTSNTYAGQPSGFDSIGLLTPNATVEIVFTCAMASNMVVAVVNYLVTANDGLAIVDFKVDPDSATTPEAGTPEDIDVVATIAANPPGH